MKHFKNFLFLSILCPLLMFTNCGEDSEDDLLLNKLNGYYSLEVNDGYGNYSHVLEFKDGDIFWSKLTDSCLNNNMKDLTLDTIVSHTPSQYVGIYKISGYDEEKQMVSNFLRYNRPIRTLFFNVFKDPKTENGYLRLTIKDAENGVGFAVDPGLIASRIEESSETEFCFNSFLSDIYNVSGDCLVPHRSLGQAVIPRTNTQSIIDDFIQTPECD